MGDDCKKNKQTFFLQLGKTPKKLLLGGVSLVCFEGFVYIFYSEEKTLRSSSQAWNSKKIELFLLKVKYVWCYIFLYFQYSDMCGLWNIVQDDSGSSFGLNKMVYHPPHFQIFRKVQKPFQSSSILPFLLTISSMFFIFLPSPTSSLHRLLLPYPPLHLPSNKCAKIVQAAIFRPQNSNFSGEVYCVHSIRSVDVLHIMYWQTVCI